MFKINQNRLIWSPNTAVPTDPGRNVVNRKRNPHNDPLEAPEITGGPFWLDLLAFFEEGPVFFLVYGLDVDFFNG